MSFEMLFEGYLVWDSNQTVLNSRDQPLLRFILCTVAAPTRSINGSCDTGT